MRERRFHVTELGGATVRLSGPDHHHLLRVLRLRVGDEVSLFDGRGRAAAGTISRLDEDVAEVSVGDSLSSGESSLAIRLAVVVPKGDRMSFIVQKATELGAVAIVPLASARGEWNDEALSRRLDRWRRVALEACKQSGRSLVPEIAPPRSFLELVESAGTPADSLWVAAPSAPAPSPDAGCRDVTLCIGPEGGWSEDELRLARERSARLFGLGPRTLRTETAAISAVALFQWCAGDLAQRP